VAVFLRTAEKRLMTQKLLKEKTEAQSLEPESEKPQPARASPVVNPLTPPQEADDVVRSDETRESLSVVKVIIRQKCPRSVYVINGQPGTD
jgi:hypothetical protein